jgi:hypothetical protein
MHYTSNLHAIQLEFFNLFIDKHQRLQNIKQLFIFFRKKWGTFPMFLRI